MDVCEDYRVHNAVVDGLLQRQRVPQRRSSRTGSITWRTLYLHSLLRSKIKAIGSAWVSISIHTVKIYKVCWSLILFEPDGELQSVAAAGCDWQWQYLQSGHWWQLMMNWCSGVMVEYRTRNQEVASSTHTRPTASNLEQVANLLSAQANSADGKRVGLAAIRLRGEGLVWLIWGDAMVCRLAAPWANCPLMRAVDGHIMCCGTNGSCQSAATSEIVKRCWSRVWLI